MSTRPPPGNEDHLHEEEKTSELSNEQLDALRDAEKQRAYEEQYRLQLKRRLCPGCGETEDIPF